MIVEFRSVVFLATLLFFTLILILNLKTFLKLRTSLVPSLVSVLLILMMVLFYFDKPVQAFLLFLVALTVSLAYLPEMWRDWAKLMKGEKVEPNEKVRLRDLLSWKVWVKLGYKHGAEKTSLIYALSFSLVFAASYTLVAFLLSIDGSLAPIIVAVVMFPVNYFLMKKALKNALEI